jgi:hypothetical protein
MVARAWSLELGVPGAWSLEDSCWRMASLKHGRWSKVAGAWCFGVEEICNFEKSRRKSTISSSFDVCPPKLSIVRKVISLLSLQRCPQDNRDIDFPSQRITLNI